jgi:glucose/arabinose dehydrogenase
MVRRAESERSGLRSVARCNGSTLLSLPLLLAAFFLAGASLEPRAAAAANGSQFVSQSVPSVMLAGQSYQVSVRFRNSGSTTWSGTHRLGSQNPHDNFVWGMNRVALGATVAPGLERTVTWTVTAPTTPGTYNFQWRLVQEFVEWFGATSANVVVTVPTPGNASQFVSQSVPSVMNAGQQYSVSARFRNAGTTTWGSGYRLGSQNPHDNWNWGANRVPLGATVGTGQERTVTWAVTAPSTPGDYNFQWRLLQLGVQWFGPPSQNVVVRVQTPGNHAQFVSQSVPSTMEAGQSYAVSVRVRNGGSTTWGGGYLLGSQNPHDNFTWGMNRVALGATVAPGQERSITWTVTAPATPGQYDFQWRMLQEFVEWFGETTSNVPIQVTPVAPAVGGGFSLRFRGNAGSDVDRVAIALDAPARPVDVGGDFTLEWWMKTAPGNATGSCVAGNGGWLLGNILFNRDVSGAGDFGEYGVSLFGTGGRLAFGVDRLGTGNTICGTASVADGAWHHVAVVRASASGALRLYVDGQLDAQGVGPTGDVSYRDGRSTSFPNSDPFLVVGGGKTGGASYRGWIDEVRVSDAARYAAAFTPAGPFLSDGDTAALYHFDEGNGDRVFDESGAPGGPSDGERRYGGTPAGPDWSTDTPFAAQVNLIFDTLATGLDGPSYVTHAGDDRLFITLLPGQVVIYDGDEVLPTPFLDITGKVGSQSGEQGLFSIAFHPDYSSNGFFYVDYTDTFGDTVVERYQVSADPNVADPDSAAVLLHIDQPAANHNGGQLQFGPDGFLWVGMGDGGGAGDPNCRAQNDATLLGKMLRLDVDQNVATPPYYGTPFDNPFAGPGDPPDEVWAEGLRNPWRFTFDRLTGALFVADVGQDTLEEVNYVAPASPGALNFGWKVMEGTACFSTSNCPAGVPPCESPLFTPPIAVYGHANGNCSVTGGYAYRGTLAPSLTGAYLYIDFCSGRLWIARQNDGQWTSKLLPPKVTFVTSFGEDVAGELYLVTAGGSLRRVRE